METSLGDVTTFSYDYRNRLTGVTRKDSGGTAEMQATYAYDALNRRIGTKVDLDGAGGGSPVQTWMVYDGDNTYADFNGSGMLTMRYLHGPAIDELLARTDSGGTSAWYLPDKLGTIRDITNTSGTVIYHAAYDSFGAKSSESGGGGDRFGFTGRELDSETGNYHVRARIYDPFLGRFVEVDPIGFDAGDANLYRYVGNGPPNRIDPQGTDWGENIGQYWDAFSSSYMPYYLNNFDTVITDPAKAAYNWVWTGTTTPSPEMMEAAMLAAKLNYMENSNLAHTALTVVGMVPCVGQLANTVNTVLIDLEETGALTCDTLVAIARLLMGPCFAAGTPLLTPDGEKPIEQFRPGDWILSAPEDDPNAPLVYRQVEAVFHTRAALFNLRVGGQTIRTTAQHPFWVDGR